ncbi:MAG: putative translation initiation inhibitor, yjgF family [Caulobacteraceae bacterium]|nr:putative translation initiation inhibitor, yjgF family [Caulobacteraceae bacterium]
MKSILAAVAAALLLPGAALAADPALKHFPVTVAPGATAPPFSGAVLAGNTLYVSGTTDTDRATGKPPPDPKDGAKLVLDNIRKTVEGAGLTMDDLVWVQIFTSDLSYYPAFNEVYRTYFKGPMPARAFIGAGSLLGGAHFEVMGIAAKPAK